MIKETLEEELEHKGKELTKEEVMKGRSSAYEFIDFDKKETLEQVAERLSELQEGTYTPQHKITYKHGFEDGAKWHAERSYSEEEVKQFTFECVANFLSNDDNKVEIKLVDVIIDRLNNRFEQFKKK